MSGEDKILDPASRNDTESKVLAEDNGGACSSNNVQYSQYNCRCGRTFTDIATEEEEGVTKLYKSCIAESNYFNRTVASSAALD